MPVSEKKFEVTAPMLVVAAAVLAGLGAAAWIAYAPKVPPPQHVLTIEAKDYLAQLQLKDVKMEAAESYVQSRLVEITGSIINHGPRNVQSIEVTCIFRNPQGQILQRERVTVVGGRKGPLPSGATKPFHLAFDDLSADWNQAMPDLVIAAIQFE